MGFFYANVSTFYHCIQINTNEVPDLSFYYENIKSNPKNNCIVYWGELPQLVITQSEIENLIEQCKEKTQ